MSRASDRTARRTGVVRRKVKLAARGRARLSVFRSSKHIYAQLIDDENGRLNIADNSPWGMDLDFSARHDITADLATDDDMRDVDIGFDHGRFSNDEGPFGRYLTPKMTVDSDGAAEGQSSREFRVVS